MGQVFLSIAQLPLLGVTNHLLGVVRLLAPGIRLSPCPQGSPISLLLKLVWVLAIDARTPILVLRFFWVVALGVARILAIRVAQTGFSPLALSGLGPHTRYCPSFCAAQLAPRSFTCDAA